MNCSWPFHSDPACEACKQYDSEYGIGVDEWLAQKAEIREAAKRERMVRKVQGQ